MRYRERDDFVSTAYDYTLTHTNGTPTDSYSGNGAVIAQYYDKMWDQEIPDFHRRKANGEVFFNAMKKSRFDASIKSSTGFTLRHLPSSCDHHYSNCGRLSQVFGLVGCDTGVFIDGRSVISRAATAAWADVNAPVFEGAVFMAELRDTVRFLRSPLASLNADLKKKRRHVSRGETLYDYLANNWLAYRYGVRPLISDVRNASKAISSIAVRPPNRFTARGYSATKGTRAWDGDGTTSIFDVNHSVSVQQEFSARAGILYEVDYRNTFGLSLADLPMAAWEVIPYSFVVDWFVNVGDYIGAITPKVGVNILGSWHTTSVVTDVSSVTSLAGVNSASYEMLGSGSYNSVSRREETVRTPGLPRPKLSTTHVADDFDLGTGRIIDSFALAKDLLFSRKR